MSSPGPVITVDAIAKPLLMGSCLCFTLRNSFLAQTRKSLTFVLSPPTAVVSKFTGLALLEPRFRN